MDRTVYRKFGKYEILQQLGSGGMGVVYKARDPIIGRLVALKTIAGVGASDSEWLKRFYREAQAAGRLQHPNIVTIYDVGDADGIPYIAMEFLDGETLAAIIRRRDRLSIAQKLSIVGQLCRGLDFAHEHGVVHRDVKPDNIFVGLNGTVKLLDFGVAHLSNAQPTQRAVVIGTIAYMSPEQINGGLVDVRSDIFSVGVVFYEFLTYAKPFDGPNLPSVMLKIVRDGPPPPSHVAPDVPPVLDRMVMKCLEQRPDDRFQSLGELSLELEQLLAPQTPPLRSTSKPRGPAQDELVAKPYISPARWAWLTRLFKPFKPVRTPESEPPPPGLTTTESEGATQHFPLQPSARESHTGQEGVEEVRPGTPREGRLVRVGQSQRAKIADRATRFNAQKESGSIAPSEPSSPDELLQIANTAAERPGQADAADLTLFEPPSSRELSADLLGSQLSAAEAHVHSPSAPAGTQIFDVRPRMGAGDSALPPVPPGGVGVPDSSEPLFPKVGLTFTASPDSVLVGRSVPVTEVPFVIGRSAKHLSIGSDMALSREQAAIDWDGKVFTVCDLCSTNGTYLNGRRLMPEKPEALRFGAIIRIGSTVLTFHVEGISELPDLTGQVIDNRFQLVRPIRSGAKAAVYEARDSRLAKAVAIKLLSPSLATYPGYLEEFTRDAHTAASLSHPYIGRILDYGRAPLLLSPDESSTANYVCMELLDGGNLADRLAVENHIQIEQVTRWLDRITDALEYMHQRGVVHSGLKPTSIVFDGDGAPYVTDFALASRAGEGGRQAVLGDPDFLAPEQWDGLEPTAATDQYALAALTYLMLTGSRPYEGQQFPDTRKKNFLRGPVPAHEQAIRNGIAELPSSVSEVLRRALSPENGDRYPSAREFFFAFERALQNTSPRRSGAPRIFVSYRRNLSAGWAVLFARELNDKHNMIAFLDTQRVDSAVRIPAKVQAAIRDCDIFVCLLAKGTLGSTWVQEEIRLAWEAGKPMIPVFQESFVAPPIENLAPHIQALINYEGVHLLDRRNLFVDQAIVQLAKIVTGAVRGLRTAES
jgi:serine/threonine protein kinase